MPNRPLTDEEIAKKFGTEVSHPQFETAKRLSLGRPDRAICDWPDLICPHCGATFAYSEGWDESDLATWDLIVCNACERVIYVENADPVALLLTLTTEPNN